MNPPAVEREESLGEEIANSISHGVGFLAALIGTPFLIAAAVQHGTAITVVGASVFAVTAVILYFTSMMYHALPRNGAKRLFRLFDHAAIFLMIAGGYTPFTFGVLKGALGWTLFGIVWSLAIFGIIFKVLCGHRHPKFSNFLYLTMGWMLIVAIKPMWEGMSPTEMFWLVAGGLSYTVGIIFYIMEHIRYGHFIWHLFVLGGTGCHFFAVYFGVVR